jgi:hypothetical protein
MARSASGHPRLGETIGVGIRPRGWVGDTDVSGLYELDPEIETGG